MRDPRLRSDGGSIEIHRRSIEGPVDMDLRPQPAKVQTVPSSGDVDLRSLPFKPVQHSAANEIDASISSHSPIVWQLLPTNVIKADYASLQIQPKVCCMQLKYGDFVIENSLLNCLYIFNEHHIVQVIW